MDLTGPNYQHSPSLLAFNGENSEFEGTTITTTCRSSTTSTTNFYGKNNANPFDDDFSDPFCRLNLKETAEFVRSFPMANTNSGFEKRGGDSVGGYVNPLHRKMEASIGMPSTPGRPVFSFRSTSRRSSLPSKWDDAEKWVMGGGGSCHGSPAHHTFTVDPSEHAKGSRKSDVFKPQNEVFVEKSRVSFDKKVPKEMIPSFKSCSAVSASLDHHSSSATFTDGTLIPFDGLLKDKFTKEVVSVSPRYGYSESTEEGFLFRNRKLDFEPMKDAGTGVVHEVKHRDMGTEMTPLGSSTTSRCHTPFKSISPARHNTPENRSGPLTLINSNTANAIVIKQLQECHLAKLNLDKQLDSVASNWSTRDEEEEEVSKSLRHFEINNGFRRSISESRACAWEEEEKTKSCLRYKREEAKIQAWLNLQSAKAEAQSRKLEVKIQKMRSNLEERLMKKMATVHRKAEEWSAAALLEHCEQIRRATEKAQKMMITHRNSELTSFSSTIIPTSCGCFPCNNSSILKS